MSDKNSCCEHTASRNLLRSHFTALLPLLLAILSTAIVSPLQAERSPALTLNEVYLQVLRRSEQDEIRKEDLAVAQARYRQSLSSYYPEIFLFGRKSFYDKYDEDDNSQLETLLRQQQSQSSNTTGSTSTGSGFRTIDPYQAGVGFRWPIFSGFQTYYESQARDAEISSAALNRQRYRQLLYRDVGEVYFQILEYEKTTQILKEEQQALRARIGELARRVRIGRSSQGELLAAQSEYSNSRVELERVEGLRQVSTELLAFLMNAPAESIVLAEPGPLPGQRQLTAYLEKVEKRTDLRAAMKTLDAEKARLQSEKGGHYPEASVEGSYYMSQKPDFGRDWGITLSIEIPLFEGGNTYYAVREYEALVRKSKLELQALRRSASYEVRSAYTDYVNALSRLALMRQSVQISRSTYYVQMRDYRLGIVSNLEVLSALRNFHMARRELVRLEMLARINEIRLHVAAGMQAEIPAAPERESEDLEGLQGSEDSANAATPDGSQDSSEGVGKDSNGDEAANPSTRGPDSGEDP
ncbi:MAG: TolC family protein [Leptospiraceae bacterium]|nr:TolC family protein [Leptospiraceae bacterium]